MDLYKEILINYFIEHCISPKKKLDVEKLLSAECYQLIKKIRAVLMDDTLDDPACFYRIEEMVTLFDHLGGCGGRHDF